MTRFSKGRFAVLVALGLGIGLAHADEPGNGPKADSAQVEQLILKAKKFADTDRQDSVYLMLSQAERLLEPYPRSTLLPRVYWRKAELFRAMGKYKEALAEVERGLKLPSYRASLLNLKAGIYFELNQPDSVFFFVRASEAARSGPRARRLHYLNYWLLGALNLSLGKKEAAIANYREALGPLSEPSSENVFQVYYKLGNLLYETGHQGAGLDTLLLAYKSAQELPTLPPEFDIIDYAEKLLIGGQKAKAHEVMAWFKAKRLAQYGQAFRYRRTMLEMATLNEKQALELTNKRLKSQEENLRNTMAAIVALASLIIVGLMIGVIRTSQQARAKLTAQNNTLKDQREELHVQKATLEQLNLTKNLLLSIVTHDVRGPVGGLKMTLDLAKDRRLSGDDLRKLLNGLADQVETTETLLNEVLLWAKTQMEGMEAELAPLALDRIMNDLVLQAGPQLQSKNVWTEEAGTATPVVANDGLLRVVLRNVLANAIRHTKPRQPILLTYMAQGAQAGLSIRDHGHGMPNSAIEQLLGGASTRQTISQHGLGLVLVRDFVHRMGGRIEVLSNSEGTLFTLWLQAAVA